MKQIKNPNISINPDILQINENNKNSKKISTEVIRRLSVDYFEQPKNKNSINELKTNSYEIHQESIKNL